MKASVSLRLRLVMQLLALAALLSVGLYLTIRTVAGQAAEASQDGVLGAATLAIAEGLRGGDDGVVVDLPYSAFSILGSISEDRIFYRIDVAGEVVTGYADLPPPPDASASVRPVFYTRPFRDTRVRIAAVSRTVLVDRRSVSVLVMVGQTRQGQEAIAGAVANRAAMLGLGFFALAALLSLVTAGSVLAPINHLAEAVGRRGPRDLRPVTHPTPRELVPLVGALNGFITRLRGALARTETFITEAAHHIRTPLSTVRARTEIALRQAETEETRATLRTVIRAVEESSRSASQLLDHATVVYRSDRLDTEPVDLGNLISGVVTGIAPTAELKDLTILHKANEPSVRIVGDKQLLQSALRNLIDNAIKYSPPDTEIALSLSQHQGFALIEVADQGRGLSGQNLTHRFARGDNAGDVVGSGLGLTIVEEVALAHGGRFELRNREGGGTCAQLWLPL